MILYEVRIAIDRELAAEYREWLAAHMREILVLPGFEFAEMLREDAHGAREVFVCHYWLDGREALENYLREHAARLRADGIRRFGDRFSAERRVLELERRIGER